ncbi:hypothetical protein Rhe02_77740 [Rhizocola hellebori]|uniref:Uncharacterized protein n=1 Tax=Rhizocola hellebori TaxID=1392758 RepID=A0A8J3QGM2_9ACTN|nr:hypothetical protein Rhe02_77740 [Rhizocola hellebori]
MEAGHAALVLGRDQTGAAVSMQLFRPQPTVVTLVGGWWAARILLFRCLGLGVQVAVRAAGGLANTAQWTELDAAAGATGQRVWPMPGDVLSWQPTEVTRLLLHLYDTGPAGPPVQPSLGSWQTQLTVLPQATAAGAWAIAGADVVLAQRMEWEEAVVLANALGLGEPTVALLTSLESDMVAVCARGMNTYAWLAPTSVERRLFGNNPGAR